MDYVTIYLDHPTVGCGFRRALVTSKGPKWVRLFYPAGLHSIELSRYTYDASKAIPVEDYDKATLADLICRQVDAAKTQQRFDGGNTAQEAVDFLRA